MWDQHREKEPELQTWNHNRQLIRLTRHVIQDLRLPKIRVYSVQHGVPKSSYPVVGHLLVPQYQGDF